MTTDVVLRDYQLDAGQRVDAAEARGVRSMLGVAATGLGKTIMFTDWIRRRNHRALVIAHRDELISQAVAKVVAAMPDRPITAAVYDVLAADPEVAYLATSRPVMATADSIGIVKGKANDVASFVVVASVQTLAREARLAQLIAAGRFGLVVVDEAHHAAADSYTMVLVATRAGEPGGPLLVGVTATPERGDGQGLDDVFQEVVFNYDILFGIRAGYLADVRAREIKLAGFDAGQLKVQAGDYTSGSSGKALTEAHAPAMVVKAWNQHARGRKTLVFTPTVQLASDMAAAFNADGTPAAFVSGDTSPDDRRRLLREFKAGTLTVLANCAVLTEGYDEPSVACVVVARPTKVQALYVQMVGRGLRRHPDKADCLVLDVVGASANLSLVTLPTLFGTGMTAKDFAGDRLASEVVEAHQAELVAKGIIEAHEVELFKQVRRGNIAWVRANDRYGRTQYTRQMGSATVAGQPVQLPTVVLAQRKPTEALWCCGLLFPGLDDDGKPIKRVLIDMVPLDVAQGLGEDYIRKNGSKATEALTSVNAAWRRKPPSPRQLAAAVKWHIKVQPEWTAGDLADAIDARATQAKLRAKPKATTGAKP